MLHTSVYPTAGRGEFRATDSLNRMGEMGGVSESDVLRHKTKRSVR